MTRKADEFRALVRRRFDIGFDIVAGHEPRFITAGKSRNRRSDLSLTPTARLLAIDSESASGSHELQRIVRELRREGCELDEVELYHRLLRVTAMRRRQLVTTIVNYRSAKI